MLKICPSSDNALNLWPAATFALLSTLAVLRIAKKQAPNALLTITADIICDDFLRAMLNERKQHKDFCCPGGFRYRSEKFPALADDLGSVFNVRPGGELIWIILALVVDRHMRSSQPTVPLWLKNQIAKLCDASSDLNEGTLDLCRRIWRRYICDPSRKVSDDKFDACVREFFVVPAYANAS